MTTNPAIATVEQIYDAMGRGDLDEVMGLCSPDVVLTQDAALPWGGRYVGRDGVAEFALKLIGAVDSVVTSEQMFSAGDHVVQHGRSRGVVRHNGESYDIAECHIWTLHNGVVAEAQFFIESDEMLAILGR